MDPVWPMDPQNALDNFEAHRKDPSHPEFRGSTGSVGPSIGEDVRAGKYVRFRPAQVLSVLERPAGHADRQSVVSKKRSVGQ